MNKFEPFDFVAFLLEKDKEILERIFKIKLHCKEDFLKQLSYEEAVEKYKIWEDEFKKLTPIKHSVNKPNKVH